MNLRKEFERVLAEALDETLAARDFEREGLGFRRERPGYIEHYDFQPSQGNLNQIRCRYYLNVGLEFPVLTPAAVWAYRREGGLVSWLGDKHVSLVHIRDEIVWATRADSMVSGLYQHWELVPGVDLLTIKRDVIAAVIACSEQIGPWAVSLRPRVWKAWLLGWLAWPFVRHKLRSPSKRLRATRSKQRAPEA
jgi:hypothetical protein